MPHARDTAAAMEPLAAQQLRPQLDPLPYLQMQEIVKRYGAVTALDTVDFVAHLGEIHALLGENGAGKSTLMHVLSGLTQPDSGTISVAGKRVNVRSPRAARPLGIAMVHQHFTLVPAFTVEENLALDADQTRVPRGYSAASAAAPALERATALGWSLQPGVRVADLGVGAQQRVEIVKALATDARLLIFDEPTAVLAGDEVTELFDVLRRLRDEGRAVILIAHKLAEILAVADRVTVLRRGHRVASCPVAETDAAHLAQWMVGPVAPVGPVGPAAVPMGRSAPEDSDAAQPASASGLEPRSARSDSNKVSLFSAQNIVINGDRGEQAICGVTLDLHRGEIFGIGGVDGNGQTELAESLVGLRPLVSGAIRWCDGPFLPGTTPRIGYIPQDRRRAGLAVTMSIEDNLLWYAVQDPKYRKGFLLRRKALRELAEALRTRYDIRTPSNVLPASALSGGNQQKIVVARALYSEPEWIVAVNPTRGLDIGATRFVHSQLRQARTRGAAIVLISTDLDELAALADRAAILSGGSLIEFDIAEADTTQIGLLLGGLGAEANAVGATR